MRKNKRRTDPRQELFLSLYNDPESPTFANALQSALKAGYKENYAYTITSHNKGLMEATDYNSMLSKAEANLDRYLTMDAQSDIQIERIKADVSKFVAERVGKNQWSTRSESVNVHVHAVSEETRKQVNDALDDVL